MFTTGIKLLIFQDPVNWTIITYITINISTSPNAPLPITLIGSKSCTPRRDLFKRRNSVSFVAWAALFSIFWERNRKKIFTLNIETNSLLQLQIIQTELPYMYLLEMFPGYYMHTDIYDARLQIAITVGNIKLS